MLDFWNLVQNLSKLFADVSGVFQRSARGRLYQDYEISLVFIRNEPFRHALENQVGEPQPYEKQYDRNQAEAKEYAQRSPVSISDSADYAINAGEEPSFFSVLSAEEDRRE